MGRGLSSSGGQCYLVSLGVSSAGGDLVLPLHPQLSAGLTCPHYRGASFPAPALALLRVVAQSKAHGGRGLFGYLTQASV